MKKFCRYSSPHYPCFVHTFLFLCISAFAMGIVRISQVYAQTPTNSAVAQVRPNVKVTPSIRRVVRPIIPDRFDRETIQRIVDSIVEPYQASILKLGYFSRRGFENLPARQGILVVTKALEAEPVASRRWFYLQNVHGWAAFRCPDLEPHEGLNAYADIFEQVGKAKEAGAEYAF